MAALDTLMDPTPDAASDFASGEARVLVIACGALAREIVDLIRMNGWTHLAVTCLPAELHNAPRKIPDLLRRKIRANRDRYAKIFIAYADCGTGGEIDRLIREDGVERIGGPHCYSFFAGTERFDTLAETEVGTFYLTDYLARHFETLILEGMGIRKYPKMRDMLFGHYTRLLHLAQTDDPTLDVRAKAAAEALGLRYEKIRTGYGELADFMAGAAESVGHAAASRPAFPPAQATRTPQ